jgi:hypothetical protein
MNIIKLPSRYGVDHYLEQCDCDKNGEKYAYKTNDESPAGYSIDTESNRILTFDPSGGPFMSVGGIIEGKIIAAIQMVGSTTHLYLTETEERAKELADKVESGIPTTEGGCSVQTECCKETCGCVGENDIHPITIGMIGKAGSGKDTVADYIVEKYGYSKIAFADPLKKAVQIMFDVDDDHMFDRDLREKELDEWRPWSVRKLLQFVGTDLMREQVDKDIWMKNAVSRIKKMNRVVISDARFPNEVDGVRERLAGYSKVFFIRVSRPGHEDAKGGIQGHESESHVDSLNADIEIINDGTVEDLYAMVDDVMERIIAEKME